MLEPNDRVVVGISGGKDSLVLLRLMAELRDHSAVPFELQAVTLNMGYVEMDFSPVADLCKKLNLTKKQAYNAICRIKKKIKN